MYNKKPYNLAGPIRLLLSLHGWSLLYYFMKVLSSHFDNRCSFCKWHYSITPWFLKITNIRFENILSITTTNISILLNLGKFIATKYTFLNWAITQLSVDIKINAILHLCKKLLFFFFIFFHVFFKNFTQILPKNGVLLNIFPTPPNLLDLKHWLKNGTQNKKQCTLFLNRL